jgi:hypothetical protein
LRANRHTGRLDATLNELARAMQRAPETIAMELEELQGRAVCSVTSGGNSNPMLEICDRFWPYQRQPTPDRALGTETEFIQKVRGLFLAQACVQASFTAADEKIAASLHRRGITLEQITRAILLGCARKYVAMINAGVRTPITSLQYFSDIIEEVTESTIPESYWEPLRSKVTKMERQWQQAKNNAWPVGQSPAAPLHRIVDHFKRNPGPHATECKLRGAKKTRNEMMLLHLSMTLFLTHVVHLTNVKTSQRRFAPMLPHITGITGPLHRNTHSKAYRFSIRTTRSRFLPQFLS